MPHPETPIIDRWIEAKGTMMDYGIPFRQHGLKYFQEVWQMDTTNTSKKLARAAYSALGEALAVIYWNKKPFESFLRTTLRDYPELLVQLNFSETKREISEQLVYLLAANEQKY